MFVLYASVVRTHSTLKMNLENYASVCGKNLPDNSLKKLIVCSMLVFLVLLQCNQQVAVLLKNTYIGTFL